MSSNRFHGVFTRLIAARRGVLIMTAIIAGTALFGLMRLESDNSPDVFFVDGSEAVDRYEHFKSLFGADQSLRLVVSGEPLWTDDGLRWLADTESALADVDGVRRITGLVDHHQRQGWPPRDTESFRQLALDNDLDRAAGWISNDGSLASVLVQLEAMSPDGLEATLEALAGAVGEPPLGLDATWLGLPILNQTLDRSSREIGGLYFPLLVVFAVVILALLLRGTGDLIAALLFVGLCELLLLAPMGFLGVRLNLVLSTLPPLVFAISLATVLHVMLRYRHRAIGAAPGAERHRRLADTFSEKGWSVFWTGATTSLGFASLAISPVGPVRSLGLWAGFALALLTVAAFLVLPALMAQLSGRPSATAGGFERRTRTLGATWSAWASRRRYAVVMVAGAISLFALAGVPRIEIESNALRYLAPDHPLRSGIEKVETLGIGVSAVELIISMPAADGGQAPFVSAITVDRLADLGTDLEAADGVLGAVSAGAALRDVALSVPSTPLNATMRQQMVLEGMAQDARGREVLADFLSEDRRHARVTLFVVTPGVEQLAALEQQVETAVQTYFPQATAAVTGELPLLLEAQRHLISTLVWSLGLTLLAVAIVLRCLLPSTRRALLALVPNLWPVLGVLGIMGWAGVPLDIATVMVASVVLGLAVDDTIHTLGHFRKLAPLYGSRDAVRRTLEATAPAYLLTGVVLSAGFGVCALSQFAPIARFGSLSAFAVVLAVIGDLFLLPALLSLTPGSAVGRLADRASKRG